MKKLSAVVLCVLVGVLFLSVLSVMAQEPCNGDFTCDGDVDGPDFTEFLNHFGRSLYFNPCTNPNPCNGDFDCDKDVDAFDFTTFAEDYGRGYYVNPCPPCEVGPWCTYP